MTILATGLLRLLSLGALAQVGYLFGGFPRTSEER
jgi:hypothetical protein